MDTPSKLPSLTALRAFEAVARRMSVTKAAEELCVTTSAVSHQVKNLEEAVGVKLLVRLHQRVELTGEGETLFRSIQQSFRAIAETIGELQVSAGHDVLSISVSPFFSAKWLTPRLPDFWARHPDVELRLHHSYQPADYLRENIDAGINWGDGMWPGIESRSVLRGELTPVCSPQLLQQHRISTPADLFRCRLLYEFDFAHWENWFAHHGLRPPEEAHRIQLDDTHALLRAAMDGYGVAMFCRALIQSELDAGVLVQPFDHYLDTGLGYHLNHPGGRPYSKKVQLFCNWVIEQVKGNPFA